jgi:hypothetical protein
VRVLYCVTALRTVVVVAYIEAQTHACSSAPVPPSGALLHVGHSY